MVDSRLNITKKFKSTDEQRDEMLEYYQAYLSYNTSAYIIARAKVANTTITFYKTNTIMFQGEDSASEYNIWAKKYALPIEEVIKDNYENLKNLSAVGSDEVGTGDYFGPIVVCATYVKNDMIDELKKIGVKDSKVLTDPQIISIGLKLKEMIPYTIYKLSPEKINQLNGQSANLNFLKAYLHNKAINSILKKIENVKYDAILIDEFTPKEKYFEYLKNQNDVITNIQTVPKGERVHIAIAAASILARMAFVKELRDYSDFIDARLYKGAGTEVDRQAVLILKNHGWNTLGKIAKLKFANTERIKKNIEDNNIRVKP